MSANTGPSSSSSSTSTSSSATSSSSSSSLSSLSSWALRVVGSALLFLTLVYLMHFHSALVWTGGERREGTPVPDPRQLAAFEGRVKSAPVLTAASRTLKSSSTNSSPLAVEDRAGGAPEFRINPSLGMFDSSRMFKVFPHVLVGERFVDLSKEYVVTLATQSSVDRLPDLLESLSSWRGPASVAVFTPHVEFDLAKRLISWMRKCHSDQISRVSFHFLAPTAFMPRQLMELKGASAKLLDKITCHLTAKKFYHQLTTLSGISQDVFFQSWRPKYAYPQSHMRNLARKTSQTDYVFTADVDIIPSPGLAEDLDEFFRLPASSVPSCPAFPRKCAFVVPTYELHHAYSSSSSFHAERPIPANKSELLRLVAQGKARPYHYMSFRPNQQATNFKLFERAQDDSALHVSHAVPDDFKFYYEPFYVSSDDVPKHDERFLGYGYTRNTQVWETKLTGWKFLVLSPAFAVHWGFDSFAARPAWRRIQASENAGVRRKWMREMEARVATAGGGDADLPGLVAIQAASAASVLVFVAASFYVGRMLLWRRRGGHLKAVLSTAMGGE